MLIDKSIRDPAFDSLREAAEKEDYERGFEIAHALEGGAANLALTPLFIPLGEITELFRNKTKADYGPLVETIIAKRDELLALSKWRTLFSVIQNNPSKNTENQKTPPAGACHFVI